MAGRVLRDVGVQTRKARQELKCCRSPHQQAWTPVPAAEPVLVWFDEEKCDG